MGIFSRINDIINSNLNVLLDKAEHPEKIIRLVIQEMEDTLVDVRSDAARTIAERKRIQRRIDMIGREIDEWGRKAELALGKGREDLARAALSERHNLSETRTLMEADLTAVEEQLEKLNDDITQLQRKLDDAKARARTLVMKHDTVSGRLRTREKLYDDRIGDAMARFEAVESKMDRMEAKVDAYDVGRTKSLEDEFAALESQDVIDQELAELKAKVEQQNKS